MTPKEKRRLKQLDKITTQALDEVDKKPNAKEDVIVDWYRYIEIVSKYIKTKILD